MAELTTKEAAQRANLSPWRIVQLVNLGTIKAHRFGHAWMIDEGSLEEYIRTPHKPGPKGPKKQQEEPRIKRRPAA
jgi:excisionase family DNA binding protein